MSKNNLRFQEALLLLYRLLLAFLFYGFARLFFIIFNDTLVHVNDVGTFFRLQAYGLTFDTISIFYTNALFILLSVLPMWINTSKTYQKVLFYVYFVCNLIPYSANFIDFIYYKFTLARTTINVFDTLKNETNLSTLFVGFLGRYWYIFLLFLVSAAIWIWLYKKVKIRPINITNKKIYFSSSVVYILATAVIMLGGIRGDLKKSTRPLNIVDASRHVTQLAHADVILNTPFTILRTVGKTSFVVPDYMPTTTVEELALPIKQYAGTNEQKPNIVIFITESYGREYLGAFNEDYNIDNYQSYTPFLDSLAKESLYFTNAYANGSKSIHGMSSVLAGIPSFKDAFTSSPFPNQEIESLVSILNDMNYDTSFFHGAPNGSMGFLGFSKILQFDHYYGKTEYNNDADFDGVWGIWDEPFFQFMKSTLDQKNKPFMATMFSVTSHEPFQVPEQYEGKFPKGELPMHQCVGYTDYAFERFFEEAKKQPWFDNTIFVITADHTNQKLYDFYQQGMQLSAVPILFYTPNKALMGKRTELAQQIDIYPTLIDYIGYEKPFRSWGRSLITPTEKPFFIGYLNNQYVFAQGDYICTFDGQKATGFYTKNDTHLKHNLIDQKNKQMLEIENACKAMVQDYFYRIIEKKLT